jgi:hypothetical protein
LNELKSSPINTAGLSLLLQIQFRRLGLLKLFSKQVQPTLKSMLSSLEKCHKNCGLFAPDKYGALILVGTRGLQFCVPLVHVNKSRPSHAIACGLKAKAAPNQPKLERH